MSDNSYKTKQRDEIVDFFTKRRGKCFSAKDIIKSGEITSGEATVYRTLSKLTESGILKRFTDGNSSCYQLADSNECASHFHLRCDKCGKLIHLDCDFINEVQNHIKAKHDFFVDIGKTVFYGLCGECAKGESNA